MDEITEFMRLAAHCRRQARTERDPVLVQRLFEAAVQYDARACASMAVRHELAEA